MNYLCLTSQFDAVMACLDTPGQMTTINKSTGLISSFSNLPWPLGAKFMESSMASPYPVPPPASASFSLVRD
ncbi:hypothetical protein TorRG33x02_184840 [Trema orientale]|uniref:Uncharacterized protein n=1 Tax=Trema orientale TaxID=63057 RepID=A0A2P5EJN6_TREOI|nr:hypothetical protein TorRG33x02_184840 [Trema orientale]